jgi:MFS family permease
MVFFAGLAALPIAWVADRYGRRTVLTVSVLIWSAATAACGLARDFDELFAALVFLGIGQAGLSPVVFGLIPQLFPARQRVLANAIYSMVATLGAALGLIAGGPMVSGIDAARPWLPAALHGMAAWRLGFVLVAVPGPVIALLVALMRLTRQAGDEAAAPGLPTVSAAQQISIFEWSRAHWRTVVGLFGSIGLVSFGFNAIGAWSPIVAARNFGATPTDVGQGLGLTMAVGTVLGGVLVSPVARRLTPRYHLATPLRVIEFGLLIALPLCLVLTWTTSSAQMFTVICMQVAPVTIGTMLFNTAMQDICPDYLRSRVLAVGLVVGLVFSTASPIAVGLISDAFNPAPKALMWAMAIVAAVGLGTGTALMRWSEDAFVRTVRTFADHPAVGD